MSEDNESIRSLYIRRREERWRAEWQLLKDGGAVVGWGLFFGALAVLVPPILVEELFGAYIFGMRVWDVVLHPLYVLMISGVFSAVAAVLSSEPFWQRNDRNKALRRRQSDALRELQALVTKAQKTPAPKRLIES